MPNNYCRALNFVLYNNFNASARLAHTLIIGKTFVKNYSKKSVLELVLELVLYLLRISGSYFFMLPQLF